MFKLSFKEWLKESPEGAGEIWDNRSNADLGFGRAGAKSKNVADGTTPGQVEFDPDKLFLGKSKKKKCRQINTDSTIGGINGTNQ